MAGKIEAALDALERGGGLAIAPFSELGSNNAVEKRVRLAVRALKLVAGEDHSALTREVPLEIRKA